MMLRPRQSLFVERSIRALHLHGNTLSIAPTGAGKSVMLSAVAGSLLVQSGAKACVLAHRDELIAQNRAKYRRVNPRHTTSVVDADAKDWSGRATFAMVQTLSREANLDAMPALDLLVIDEAHHAAAPAYRRVIEATLAKNARAKLFGVTATPSRGDGRGLREVFSNVADQITLSELIASGHLVPPKTYAIDVGAGEALDSVQRRGEEFDMAAVEAILNKTLINTAVVRTWKQYAGDRKTIAFCSTIAHATSVHAAFVEAGARSVLVHGELSDGERRARLKAYETGDAQVVVNVSVLTEGYDYTPTSCIVLLRPTSHKSTLAQMVGRGLRTVDPAEFPNVVKSDCIVLDFGTATRTYGSLEQDASLDAHGGSPTAPTKQCPQCNAILSLGCRECPLCGHEWTREIVTDTGETLEDFIMTEIDLLKRSNFRWVDLFGGDDAWMATGFHAWGGVFGKDGRWFAVGGGERLTPRLLATGARTVCLAAADDWLNEHESVDAAHKSRRWLSEPPTAKQLRWLPAHRRRDYGLTRYDASAHLAFQFNRPVIEQLVQAA